MKLIYLANDRLPTEKAYGINIVKTCEALGGQGTDVTILAPKGKNRAGEALFSYYGIPKNFEVVYIPIFDAVSRGWRLGFFINQFSFAFSVLFSSLPGNRKETIILARDEFSSLFLKLRRYRVFYDMHGFPEYRRWYWKFAMQKMAGIIVTNIWKAEQLRKLFNVPSEKILIAPNGFDPAHFQIKDDTMTLRKELDLPQDRPIVMYTGHLYGWKGAGVLLKTARSYQLPVTSYNPLFVFVGGTPWDIERFREEAKGLNNVLIVGHKPHDQIPRYLKAADVLVLPNSAKEGTARMIKFSKFDTSPIKMFEYMASGVPIIASDLPSLKEILNERNSVLVEPDNPEALKEGIQKVLGDKNLAKSISEKALEDVQGYTWEKRAERIIDFITRVQKDNRY